jgi:hypothetical protein
LSDGESQNVWAPPAAPIADPDPATGRVFFGFGVRWLVVAYVVVLVTSVGLAMAYPFNPIANGLMFFTIYSFFVLAFVSVVVKATEPVWGTMLFARKARAAGYDSVSIRLVRDHRNRLYIVAQPVRRETPPGG